MCISLTLDELVYIFNEFIITQPDLPIIPPIDIVESEHEDEQLLQQNVKDTIEKP